MYVCKRFGGTRTRAYTRTQARGAVTPEPELRRVTDTTPTPHVPRLVRRQAFHLHLLVE